MAVDAGNVGVICNCQCILCLDNFNVVCNSRSESIPGLLQVLSGQCHRTFLDRSFLRRRFQIEISVANLQLYPGSQVFKSLSFLCQRGMGPENIPVDSPTLKDWNAECGGRINSSM